MVGFFAAAFDFRDADEALFTVLDLDLSEIKPCMFTRLAGVFMDTQSSRTRLRLPPASTERLSGGGEVWGEFGYWRGRDAYVRLMTGYDMMVQVRR